MDTEIERLKILAGIAHDNAAEARSNADKAREDVVKAREKAITELTKISARLRERGLSTAMVDESIRYLQAEGKPISTFTGRIFELSNLRQIILHEYTMWTGQVHSWFYGEWLFPSPFSSSICWWLKPQQPSPLESSQHPSLLVASCSSSVEMAPVAKM